MPFRSDITHPTPCQKQNSVLFILLGASNLSRSFGGLKSCIKRCLLPGSANFIHAMGPGRGYISRGGILNTTYPPIINSGIIEAVRNKKKPNQKVVALITDIGNDIMYGVPPEEIIGGLQYIFDSLDEFEADVLITSISVDLKNDISDFYFRILRQIFFPRSKVQYFQTLDAIESINTFIHRSSNEKIKVISDMKQFCGLDKIHYSILRSHRAWSYLARKLTDPIRVSTPSNIKIPELALSLVDNFYRILLVDMLRIRNKTKETF